MAMIAWRAFMLTHRWNDLVDPGRIGGTSVLDLEDDIGFSHYFTITSPQNILQWRWWCAFILVESMNDLVGPGRIGRTFVFWLVCLNFAVLLMCTVRS